MAIIDSLKSKKLPIGVFAGIERGPQPARIFITLNYSEELNALLGSYKGFTIKSFNTNNKPTGTIAFEIPVTPPTVEIDFGNTKDSENVTRVGEVVLPKYKQAQQLRWTSFFPYDYNAPYINTNVRNFSWSGIERLAQDTYNTVTNAVNSLTGVLQTSAPPQVFNQLFEILAKSEEPFTVSMTYYNGGHLPAKKYTLDTFKSNPESNGDYTYSISVVEWTDIKPKLLNNDGSEIKESDIKVADKFKNKIINSIYNCYTFCKQNYPVVSKKLVWAFATYNGIRNLVFQDILMGWKIKGSLQDLAGRFGILNNILGKSKITRQDTAAVSNSLKQLSFSKASRQLADLLEQNTSV